MARVAFVGLVFVFIADDQTVDAFDQAGVVVEIAIGDCDFAFGFLHGFASSLLSISKKPRCVTGAFMVSDDAGCLTVSVGIDKSQEIAKTNFAITV